MICIQHLNSQNVTVKTGIPKRRHIEQNVSLASKEEKMSEFTNVLNVTVGTLLKI